MKEIFLNENSSKRGQNTDNFVNVELVGDSRILLDGNVMSTVDAYEEYMAEKDASDRYRLIFTINPICSNILFNACTEIVYREGSDDCVVLETAGKSVSDCNNAGLYNLYKYGDAERPVSREDAIKDTSYSSKDIGPFVYHCGADIFNNHMLRATEFFVVNKLSDENEDRNEFNTISDYIRDASGNTVSEKILKIDNNLLPNVAYKRHLRTIDTTKSFQRSVNDNLIEYDGWVGFLNPSTLNIPNIILLNESGDTTAVTVNKCINNNKAGEQIDMYPDRSLYSFIPKVNREKNRLEPNWDYCITYPYKNVYNDDVQATVDGHGKVPGLKCSVISKLSNTIFGGKQDENGLAYLKTEISNSFEEGDLINISVIYSSSVYESVSPLTVERIGFGGDDTSHIFAVNIGMLYHVFCNFGDVIVDEDGYLKDVFEIRVRKFVSGADCQYYIRQFRKLPNLNGVNLDEELTDKRIESLIESRGGFSNTINKVAFSENIYSDRIAQIIFNDDIITTGVKDNLGRDLSEIYLTIVKRNRGYDSWYNKGVYSDDESGNTVEFSHCFGKVTSGFDLAPDTIGHNVRKLHNVDYDLAKRLGVAFKNSPLEPEVTISNEEFMGDLVEFSPYEVKETVLEDVYHRFNTAQREIGRMPVRYQTLISDDFDLEKEFSVETRDLFDCDYINISPEGYFYKPHYRIKIHEYSNLVKQGKHRMMAFKSYEYDRYYNICTAETVVNYYLQAGERIRFTRKDTLRNITGTVLTVSGKNFTEITVSVDFDKDDDINNYYIFKINPEKPSGAYELNDGTGRYLWREVLSNKDFIEGDELYDTIFTNGAHYFHDNINFYLRRQDPTGEYGLNVSRMDEFTGAAEGKIKDVTVAEYVSEEKGENIC